MRPARKPCWLDRSRLDGEPHDLGGARRWANWLRTCWPSCRHPMSLRVGAAGWKSLGRGVDPRHGRRAARQRDMTLSTAPSSDLVAGDLMPVGTAVMTAGSAARTDPAEHAARTHGAGWQVFALDAADRQVPGRRHRERPVAQLDPGKRGPAGQAPGLSGERWTTPTVVAATKLMIPRSRRPLVPRPGLSARLDGDYRLALRVGAGRLRQDGGSCIVGGGTRRSSGVVVV